MRGHAEVPSLVEPKVKHIFIFNPEEHQHGAEGLASLNWMHDPKQKSVRHFPKRPARRKNTADDISCFADMQPDDFQHMVFLGHSNTETYAGYTAEMFVKTFAKQFALTPCKDKSMVGRLDLIGCELGLIGLDGTSLAQQIADELKRYGFIHATIHAIASPVTLPKEAGMITEVVSGAAYFGVPQPGSINAYLLDSEEKTMLEKAMLEGVRFNVGIEKIIGKKPIYFLHGADPIREFAKTENMFIPEEKPAERLTRIQQDAGFQKRQQYSKEKAAALKLITQRFKYTKAKIAANLEKNSERSEKLEKNKLIKTLLPIKRARVAAGEIIEKVMAKEDRLIKLAENLNLLRIVVEKSAPEDWQTTIKYNLPRFETIFFREKRSTTYKILSNLAEADLEAAEEMVARQDNPKESEESEPSVNPSSSSGQITIPDRIVPTLRSTLSTSEAESNQRANEIKVRYRNKRGDVPFQNALNEINTLIGLLDAEIEKLSQDCFAFLHRYEIHTKITKRDELKTLKNNAGNFADLQRNAQTAKDIADPRTFNALKKNRNANGEWVKNRTGELIDRIAKGSAHFNYHLIDIYNKGVINS